MKVFDIRIELAVNPGFPKGSSKCGFAWRVPLDDHFMIDLGAWLTHPDQFQVTRFWENETMLKGQFVQKTNNTWYMAYSDGKPEPILQLEKKVLLPGQFIDIRDHGDQLRIFKVISIAVVNTSIPDVENPANPDARAVPGAIYHEVELGISALDQEDFLGPKYTLTIALKENGKIDLDEWKLNGKKWSAACEDSSGLTRTGDLVSSMHVWYLHFREPEETYELIKEMEKFVFLNGDQTNSPLLIRDRSGHWQTYKVINQKSV